MDWTIALLHPLTLVSCAGNFVPAIKPFWKNFFFAINDTSNLVTQGTLIFFWRLLTAENQNQRDEQNEACVILKSFLSQPFCFNTDIRLREDIWHSAIKIAKLVLHFPFQGWGALGISFLLLVRYVVTDQSLGAEDWRALHLKVYCVETAWEKALLKNESIFWERYASSFAYLIVEHMSRDYRERIVSVLHVSLQLKGKPFVLNFQTRATHSRES